MPVDATEERVDVSTELTGLDALDLAAPPRAARAAQALLGVALVVAALGTVILGWHLLVESGWKPRYALEGPGAAWDEFRRMWGEGQITQAVRITMGRAIKGYALAMVLGLTMGIVLASSTWLRRGYAPIVTGLQTMPSVAWFPLAILLFRISEQSILVVVVLGAAPSIINGLLNGVDNVPPLLRRAGRVLGARGVAHLRHVMLPAAVPSFIGGMKQGWAFAWRSLLAGELLVIVPGRPSLGALLQTARDLSDSAMLLATMSVILVIGIVIDTLFFGRLERYVRHRYGLDLA
jgi:NitT/TauT family transport system permease protein